jgi:hypothetical protein
MERMEPKRINKGQTKTTGRRLDIPVHIEIVIQKHRTIDIPLPQEFWETLKEDKLYLIAKELEYRISVVMMNDDWSDRYSKKRHSLRSMKPRIIYLNISRNKPNSTLSSDCLLRKLGQREDDPSKILRKYLKWMETKKEN